MTRGRLMAIYRALFAAYGPQGWWPGDSPLEVMIGAVLTQGTAWTNVEKAIANLKRAGPLAYRRLRRLPSRRLAALVRPSGYHRVKAQRLRNLLGFLGARYGGSPARMARDGRSRLREGLLSVNGIGPETADAIMLYAAGHPVFVVDAYTKRMLGRHGFIGPAVGYDEVQRLFHDGLPRNARLFNEYHALIVRVGKERCRKSTPRCTGCPLERFPHRADSGRPAKILHRRTGAYKI